MLISVLIGLSAPLLSVPSTASAGGWPTWTTLNTAPTEIIKTVNSTMTNIKNFVLDRLAYVIAKQILHQITASVISWINSGFKGSPSFLTNPETFFMNVGDQITGAFIQDTGILKGLCSPFSLDIRLSLALNQVQFKNDPYTCTFKTIAKNAQNADITLNGTSIKGFVEGDFSKGGWPAFITMTTQPQNNAYGAWLTANSDLQFTINSQTAKAKANISIGQGFMNFEKCDPAPAGATYTNSVTGAQDIAPPIMQNTLGSSLTGLENNSYGSQSINSQMAQAAAMSPTTVRIDPGVGSAGNQVCHTETPGSIIAGKLSKNLNTAETQLELANDINAIIDALVSQLATQLLGGLVSMSKGSGGKPSYTTRLFIDSVTKNKAVATAEAGVQATIIDPVQQYKDTYDTAVSNLTSSQNSLKAAQVCLTNTKIPALQTLIAQYQNQPYYTSYVYTLQGLLVDAQTKVTNINNSLTNQLTPMLTDLTTKQTSATTDLQNIQTIGTGANTTTTFTSGQSATITIGSPTTVIFNNSFTDGTPIIFSTTGNLPTGITAGTTYYVIPSSLTSSSFEFSSSVGGSPVNTSGTQSGAQSISIGCAPNEVCYDTMAHSILDSTSPGGETTAALQAQLDSLTNGGAQSVASITASRKGEADSDLTNTNNMVGTLNQLSASAMTACTAPIPTVTPTALGFTTVVSPTPITVTTATPPLAISSVTASSLGTNGSLLTINGTGFTGASRITLTSSAVTLLSGAANPVTTQYVSSTTLQASVPDFSGFGLSSLPVSVTVTDNGVISNSQSLTLKASP